MEALGKIFGNIDRVKIMRLFLFNQKDIFDIEDIIDRSLTTRPVARRELNMLTKIGFLKKKTFSKKVPNRITKKNPKPSFRRVKKHGWLANTKFDLLLPLKSLLVDFELVKEQDLIKRFKKTGNIKLLALSGLFTHDENRSLDMLVVGDNMKRDLFEKEIKKLESEIGRELAYAKFDSAEFDYRISMYDKLIRDVIENKNIFLINKILD